MMWKRQALAVAQRHRPLQRWQAVAETLQARHEAPGQVRARALEAHVRGETARPARPRADVLAEAGEPEGDAAAPALALPPSAARSPHFMLDAQLRESLARLLQRPAPVVTVYASQAADALARRYGADALTYGDQVLFRAGAFQPDQPAGRALIGHELTHVAQSGQVGQGPPQRRTRREQEALEGEALEAEAQLLHGAAPPVRSGTTAPTSYGPTGGADRGWIPARPAMPAAPATRPASSHAEAAHPQAALTGRDLPAPDMARAPVGSSSALSEQQLRQIKDAVYQDLVARIRVEFERGG